MHKQTVDGQDDQVLDDEFEEIQTDLEDDNGADEDHESESGEAAEGDQNGGEAQEDDGDELVVQIEGEAPPQDETEHAPKWVKELRKNHRELQREKRELEERVKALTAAPEQKIVLGAKPKLEDHDYDSEAYEAALEQWYENKRAVEAEKAKAAQAEQEAQKVWNSKLEAYANAKKAVKVRDFDEAEAVATEHLSVTQQGIIVQGAENPALVVYALGRNPKKAKELSGISDPVRFAFAIAKLETQLKVSNRKSAPPPEKTVSGTSRVSGSVDSTLDRLRAEAEKTGDYSKVLQYKKQKRAS